MAFFRMGWGDNKGPNNSSEESETGQSGSLTPGSTGSLESVLKLQSNLSKGKRRFEGEQDPDKRQKSFRES